MPTTSISDSSNHLHMLFLYSQYTKWKGVCGTHFGTPKFGSLSKIDKKIKMDHYKKSKNS